MYSFAEVSEGVGGRLCWLRAHLRCGFDRCKGMIGDFEVQENGFCVGSIFSSSQIVSPNGS